MPCKPLAVRSLSTPILVAAVTLARPVNAGELATPGEESVRHHLATLNASGLIQMPTTTWPLDCDAFSAELDRFSDAPLAKATRRSVAFFESYLQDASQPKLEIAFASDMPVLRDFMSDWRDRSGVRFTKSEVTGPLEIHLEASALETDLDASSLRLDGSYLALNWNDWRVGFGRVDRWWGPGWQSSLILSHNARPSPGFYVDRTVAKRTDLPALRALGPWDFSAFANQLERNRIVPGAKLLGARFTFMPLPALEIGISRTAQWGGEGRPESLDSFIDLLLGRDNVGDDGIEWDGSNEPGNQLGGFDVRWTTSLIGHPVTLYGQLIGEDEAGGLPSRTIGMLGLETPVATDWAHGRVFVEASDTTMNFLSDAMPNSTYNHHIYRSGYRYFGNAIGASSDNDSRTLSVGGYHELGSDQSVTWKALYASLNRDGVAAGNPVSPARDQAAIVSVGIEKKLSDRAKFGLQGHHAINDPEPDSGLSKSSIRLAITLTR